jgi:hypothetical protein
MMMKWYSFSGPCGARLVYIICWGTTKDQKKNATDDVSNWAQQRASYCLIFLS